MSKHSSTAVTRTFFPHLEPKAVSNKLTDSRPQNVETPTQNLEPTSNCTTASDQPKDCLSATGKCWVGPWFAADALGMMQTQQRCCSYWCRSKKKTSAAGSNMKLRVLLLLLLMGLLLGLRLLGQLQWSYRSCWDTGATSPADFSATLPPGSGQDQQQLEIRI